MHDFAYHAPTSLDAALALLRDNEDSKLLAGGMTMLPTLKQRLAAPTDLIDLAQVPGLSGIRIDGDELVIGAMTCHADVAESAEVRRAIPALAELAHLIADPAVRHRGTMGGSVSNADPAADYPAALLAFDATIVTTAREIAADEFFVGLFETVLARDEIVTAVRFKRPERAAYQKSRHPASGYAVAGVMVAQFADGVRVGVTGVATSAMRMPAMEEALSASFTPKAIEGIDIDPDDLMSDVHCSAAYRARLVNVLARRAVADAIARTNRDH